MQRWGVAGRAAKKISHDHEPKAPWTGLWITGADGDAVNDQDRLLIRAFAEGETNALDALADRYESDLLGLARGLLGGRRELAEDAVQDVWVRVIRSARTYAGRASVRTWLYRITVNRCRDLSRLEHRRQRRGREAIGGPVAAEPADAGMEDRESLAALQAAVDGLDRRRREVLLLCYHADLTHEHVADVLEIPLGTVKSRLNAALTSLRQDLAKESE